MSVTAPRLGSIVTYNDGTKIAPAIVINAPSSTVDLFVFTTATTVTGVPFDSSVVPTPVVATAVVGHAAIPSQATGTWRWP